jgi:hypothetical protein
MKTIFTNNITCIITGNEAFMGQGGSPNQNVHTPLSGVSHSTARFFHSAGNFGAYSRFGFLLIFLLTTFIANAQTVIKEGDVFAEGGIHYKVTKIGLVGGNAVAVYNGGTISNAYSGYVILPEKVSYANKEFDVTSLDDDAFRNCYALDSVYIPGSVVSIGKRAFKNCDRIQKMTIPNSVVSIGNSAFYNCNVLRTMVLPVNLTAISDSLFYECYRLSFFQLPEKLISIGKLAFRLAFTNQNALDDLVIPDKVTTIGDGAFSDSYLVNITLGNSVISIGEGAFAGCIHLHTISIPNSVTSIGGNAFYGCTSLSGIQLSNALTSIQSSTFSGCSSLRTVVIPNSVTTIGDGAFYNCAYLGEVVLPGSLTTIGLGAFNRCTNLSTLNFPASVTQVKDLAFAECTKLSTTMNVSQYLTEIGRQAFKQTDVQFIVSTDNKNYASQDGVLFNKMKTVALHCPTSKTTFTFPNTLKKIDEYAFSKSMLINVVLPTALDSISKYAFQNCTALNQLTLPASLKGIKEYAFAGCSNLQKIKAFMDNPPQIFTTVFGSVPTTCQLQVPLNSVDLYKAANGWKSLTIISFGGAIGSTFNLNGVNYKIMSETDAQVIGHQNGSHNYTGAIVIPSNVNYLDVDYMITSIDKTAFAYSGITSVSIPNSVKFIGEWAFTNCHNLTGVTVPNQVTFLGEGAFSNCSVLTTAVLSNTLTSIENNLFHSCRALTNFVIPASVLSIGEYAFDQCYGLITLNIPSSVTQIGKWAFQLCRELQNINISDAVEILPDYVFWGCESLQEVKLPASLKIIGEEAFYNCNELAAIDLPLSLTSIGKSAFYNTALSAIRIPATVNHIGTYAFNQCDNLKDVYAYNRTPIGITRDVFSDLYQYNLNLYVRSRSMPLYKKTAVWKDFQIKSIESIHTNSIRELTGRDIVVKVNTMLVENEDQFTAFQFEMKYDTLRMVYKDYSTNNLMTSGGSVAINSNVKGILKVGYMSDNTLSGEGTLINLRFKIRNSGIVQPEFKRFLYNAYDLINFNHGAIEVIAYGDVDYNQEVQSYDASMVLINSVGLNPLPEEDPFPWEDLRNDVSDVDASSNLTAVDAGLILRKSVDLIDKFPIEVPAPAPIKQKTAVENAEMTDVIVTLENNQLLFKSYGDLIGMNVDIKGEISILEMPRVHASFIQARNINDTEYKVALAAANVLPDGTIIMTIPLKNELHDDLELTMNINGLEKVMKINSFATNIETIKDDYSPVYLNPITGELIIKNPDKVYSIDVFTVSGIKILSQSVNSEGIVRPGSLVDGMYLVVLTGKTGNRSTTKIILK